jgi:hypothetical protein
MFRQMMSDLVRDVHGLALRNDVPDVIVDRFLKASHSDLYSGFEKIAAIEVLKAAARSAANNFIHFLLNSSEILPHYCP